MICDFLSAIDFPKDARVPRRERVCPGAPPKGDYPLQMPTPPADLSRQSFRHK